MSKTVIKNGPRTAEIIDSINFVEDIIYNQFVEGTVVLFTSSFNGIIYLCSSMAYGDIEYISCSSTLGLVL